MQVDLLLDTLVSEVDEVDETKMVEETRVKSSIYAR